jgi:hypothetical protein
METAAMMLTSTYLAVKFFFLFGLVRASVKFEPLQERPILLAALYTAGIAFLSWAFLLNQMATIPWRQWELWLAKSFGLAWLYFWLLGRLEDAGVVWWIVLLAGFGLVWF